MKPLSPLPAALSIAPFSYSTGLLHVSPKRLRAADLHAPFRGTRDSATASLEVARLARTFATRMPPSAFFSSATAAALHGIPLPPQFRGTQKLHVAMPLPARATQTRNVVGHAVTMMGDDTVERGGLRVSSVVRTWCELAAILALPDLVAAGDYIIHHELPLASITDLSDAVARYPGRRGRPLLRRALPLLSERAESAQESRLRVFLVAGGVTGIYPNLWVTIRQHRLRIDLAIPQRKLAIEHQSEYHFAPDQRRKDMTRASILASDEWLTLEFNSDDMQSPREIVERVRATLRNRPTWPES